MRARELIILLEDYGWYKVSQNRFSLKNEKTDNKLK